MSTDGEKIKGAVVMIQRRIEELNAMLSSVRISELTAESQGVAGDFGEYVTRLEVSLRYLEESVHMSRAIMQQMALASTVAVYASPDIMMDKKERLFFD